LATFTDEGEILHLKTELLPLKEALGRFHNGRIRKFVEEALNVAPDGFWLDPCSSSGRYHPPFDQVVPGGIVNHVLVATYCVEEGIRRYPKFTDGKSQPNPDWLDRARATAMLHDIAKYGIPWGDHTVSNHGHLGAELLERLGTFEDLEPIDQDMVLRGVRWHMGRWEKGFETDHRRTVGFHPFELLIQEADFYSTRVRIRVAEDFDLINFKA
jgi:hypothetical protein